MSLIMEIQKVANMGDIFNHFLKFNVDIKGGCFTFFKMSLNSTPNHIEDNENETLIIASISTLKRSGKKCGRN